MEKFTGMVPLLIADSFSYNDDKDWDKRTVKEVDRKKQNRAGGDKYGK